MQDPDHLYEAFLKRSPWLPTTGQAEALKRIANFIAKSSSDDTYLLKGFAGTGKTTIISILVKSLPGTGVRTVLMAPTGRASKVMSNYSGKAAFTIHRKIYRPKLSDGHWVSWMLAPNNHTNTLFIVDEASMISDRGGQADLFPGQQNLLEDLINYVKSGNNCRLLLIGDLAQLPPVGQEESPALNITVLTRRYGLRAGHYELTEVVRQASESGILVHATKIRESIRNGKAAILFDNKYADFIRTIGADLGDLLVQSYHKNNPQEAIVICRSNRSANNYNRQIRYSGLWMEDEICAGDFIMCVKNNYFWLGDSSAAGFIANGDILRINRVSGTEDYFGFRFANLSVELVDYPDQPPFDVKVILDSLYTESPALTREQMNNLYQRISATFPAELSKTARQAQMAGDPFFQALQIKFAYAVTCHKAQGGQWKTVFVDQGYLTEEMVDINYLRWLYTAITRATEKVYLVNFSERFFEST